MKYKTCTKCNYPWETREELISDPLIKLIGYQANMVNPDQGLLLFNHRTKDCKTTLSVMARDFNDLYGGPQYKENLFETDKCNGMCLDINNLEACGERCLLAFYREIIQKIKNWPKNKERQGAKSL